MGWPVGGEGEDVMEIHAVTGSIGNVGCFVPEPMPKTFKVPRNDLPPARRVEPRVNAHIR